VLGLQYLFYLTRKLTCEQFTCKVLNKFPVVPGPPLKGKGGEVIKMDERVGEGKALGRGSLTRGRDGRVGRVWQVRERWEWEKERWGSIASCSQGDRRHCN